MSKLKKVLGIHKQAMKKHVILLTLALIALMCWGFGTIGQATTDPGEKIPQAPDYQKTSSWVFQTPAPDKPIDVFYVYPTVYAKDSPANKLLNLGAVFFNDTTSQIEREIPHYAGAYVDPETGALVTRLPEELDVGSFPPGVYHRYDYALWYRNLQANVKVRCEKYFEQINK